jgi:hypothetical protein
MDRVQDGNARLTLDLAKARTHRAVVDGHVGRERRAGDLRGRTERACSVGQRQRGSERVCCLSGGWDRKVARTLTGGMLGSSTAAGSPPPVLPFRGSCTRPCVSNISGQEQTLHRYSSVKAAAENARAASGPRTARRREIARRRPRRCRGRTRNPGAASTR